MFTFMLICITLSNCFRHINLLIKSMPPLKLPSESSKILVRSGKLPLVVPPAACSFLSPLFSSLVLLAPVLFDLRDLAPSLAEPSPSPDSTKPDTICLAELRPVDFLPFLTPPAETLLFSSFKAVHRRCSFVICSERVSSLESFVILCRFSNLEQNKSNISDLKVDSKRINLATTYVDVQLAEVA